MPLITALIATCLSVWSVMTMLCALPVTFAQLALARLGVGVGEAGCTPAALVARASAPDQQVVGSDLAGIASAVTSARLESPSLLVVGEVASLAGRQTQLLPHSQSSRIIARHSAAELD